MNDTIRVEVLNQDLVKIGSAEFADAYAADELISNVIAGGALVKVFVGDNTVSSLGE